jgi:hypothetical protein
VAPLINVGLSVGEAVEVTAGERRRGNMGMVIRFPLEERIGHPGRPAAQAIEPASIIILPVVRIERHCDEPAGTPGTGGTPGRGRRGRATRS